MKRLAIRELLLPLMKRFSEPESLAPFFVVSLYQALFRASFPAGLAPKVVDAALKRCCELERIWRKCDLPSPGRWAKDPLHPRILRLAVALTATERAELGSILLCYLHGQPVPAISLWWQEKADFEVCKILELFLGERYRQTEESKLGPSFPERARLELRVLGPADVPAHVPGDLLGVAGGAAAQLTAGCGDGHSEVERVVHYRKGKRGNIELEVK